MQKKTPNPPPFLSHGPNYKICEIILLCGLKYHILYSEL